MKKIIMLLLALVPACAAHAQTIPQKLDELVSAYALIHEFTGTAFVAKNGEVLLEKGFGLQNIRAQIPNSPATVFEIASVTKTFTAALILKLAEEKKLSLDDRLSKYYPAYPRGEGITIRQLLTHTSGIYNYTEDGDFMHERSGKPASEKEMMALFEHQPLEFEPGKGWKYSNSGYQLLGYIIRKVTGLTYQQAIRNYIFQPLNMTQSGFDFIHLDSLSAAKGYYDPGTGNEYTMIAPLIDSSVTLSAGSIYSTVNDLYKWHRGLQQSAIISNESLKLAYTPGKDHYGYGWIVDSLYGKKMVSHSGGVFGFRSNFARIPEDDICVILLSNTETPALNELTRSILALLYEQPYTVPRKKQAVILPAQILQHFAGNYLERKRSLKIEIKLENGELVAYPYQGPRSVLAAIDGRHFFIKDQQGIEIEFKEDKVKNVQQMILKINGDTHLADRVK
ncbi:class A beta-lactamase-related serine hydrolase [Mucilaginibacter conchicola]|uniref:Class A beta-lactamase-related serine hydrolase n=1 Tax=Mucilaginibacter conchicola TaxID=2303333 RepID=A0A372NMD0_9SPHI|nr:serine hydrolase domain-containing protein [Mucilaginibacter conchicola]RFZ90094.1 class A beta-lactamase-related serine hydrolase [Mucilaginibacter conchicola]